MLLGSQHQMQIEAPRCKGEERGVGEVGGGKSEKRCSCLRMHVQGQRR